MPGPCGQTNRSLPDAWRGRVGSALKDGFYRAKAKARRRAMNAFIRDMTEQIARFEELTYRDSTLPRFRPPELYDPDYEPPSGQ